MASILLKDIIKTQRRNHGLTQKELADGLCGVSTIQRMERGDSSVSHALTMVVLDRLGIPKDKFYFVLNNKESVIETLRDEIVSLNVQFERASAEEKPRIRERALEKHRELLRTAGSNDKLTNQFLERSKEILGKDDGPYSFEESLKILVDAIKLTSPKFSLDRIEDGLYSEDEVKIIDQIATIHIAAEKYQTAADILKQLLRYVQNPHRSLSFVVTCMPLVACNYAGVLSRLGWYEDALKVIELGKKICIDYRPTMVFPDLVALEAKCYCCMSDYDRGLHLYHQAYYLYEAFEDEKNRIRIGRNIIKLKENGKVENSESA